jgi:hypothetical protein
VLRSILPTHPCWVVSALEVDQPERPDFMSDENPATPGS